jgi:anti-sigma B factor antagonist
MEEVKIIGLKDGNLEIALSGDIDLSNAEAFYQDVMAAFKRESANLTFDCEKLNFIDSTTLGTFVKILKVAKTDGKSMKLVKLQPKIKKLFLICSLNTIMEIE